MGADAALQRRGDMGEFEIELGGGDLGPGRVDGGHGRALLLQLLIRAAGRRIIALAQGQHPGELGRRPLHPRLRLGELGLGGIEIDLIGPGIDDEEQIALLDPLPVGEMDLRQIAADPGANRHELDRLELAGELVPFGDGLLQGMADGDRRRLGRCCGGGFRRLPGDTIIVEEDAGHGGHQQDGHGPAGSVTMTRGRRGDRRRGWCARTGGRAWDRLAWDVRWARRSCRSIRGYDGPRSIEVRPR